MKTFIKAEMKTQSPRNRSKTTSGKYSIYKRSPSTHNSFNKIQSFKEIPIIKNETLKISSPTIKSFTDAVLQPFVHSIEIDSPFLSRNPYFKEMCLIVFGEQIEKINGEKVLPKVKEYASFTSKVIRPYLVKGYILTSLNPIHVIHHKTRQQVNVKYPTKQVMHNSTIHKKQKDEEKSILDEKTIENIFQRMINLSKELNHPKPIDNGEKRDSYFNGLEMIFATRQQTLDYKLRQFKHRNSQSPTVSSKKPIKQKENETKENKEEVSNIDGNQPTETVTQSNNIDKEEEVIPSHKTLNRFMMRKNPKHSPQQTK